MDQSTTVSRATNFDLGFLCVNTAQIRNDTQINSAMKISLEEEILPYYHTNYIEDQAWIKHFEEQPESDSTVT